MRVSHLLFDFFGTLVHYRDGVVGNPVTRSLQFLDDLGVPLDAEVFTTRWHAVWDDIDRAASTTLREVHMHDGAKRFFRDLGHPADEATIAAFVASYIDDWNEGVVDIEGLPAMLRTLDVPASIVSNTFYPPLVPGHVARLGLRERFAYVHTSIDHGYRKPHASIYEAALDAAGVDAAEVLFVGDNPDCDYHGPRRAGMRAVLVSPCQRDGIPETHRIGHVLELCDWLHREGIAVR
jgi:putative hydrolase of the HAD superfamily